MVRTAETPYDSDIEATGGDPGLALRNELRLISEPVERAEEVKEGYVTAGESLVLSFNRHPVLETTVAAMTLAGAGLATRAVLARRRAA